MPENENTPEITPEVVETAPEATPELPVEAAPVVGSEQTCSCGKTYVKLPNEHVTCECGAVHA